MHAFKGENMFNTRIYGRKINLVKFNFVKKMGRGSTGKGGVQTSSACDLYYIRRVMMPKNTKINCNHKEVCAKQLVCFEEGFWLCQLRRPYILDQECQSMKDCVVYVQLVRWRMRNIF